MARYPRSDRRGVNERAVARTVSALIGDRLPQPVIRQVISRYVQECRNTVLERNTRIVVLTQLKVGEAAPWRWSVVRPKGGTGVYLQTPDRRRGREVLGDADADWQVIHQDGELWVRRVS